MRDYQCTKNNPYLLPHHLYMRILYIIRDYERLKEKSQTLKPDSKGNTPGKLCAKEGFCDAVCSAISPPERAAEEANAIEEALLQVPAFYREGVIENIMDGSRYPVGADERTFRRYKQRYIYYVAKLLSCI